MTVTAQMVKELREKSGAGMMDCKKALTENNGDIDASIDWLREKGIAKAAKKADRIAAEGLTNIEVDGNKAVIVEINSETDFVAKNDQFIQLTKDVATALLAATPTTLEDAMNVSIEGKTMETYLAEKTSTIGEKLNLRRFEILTKTDNDSFGAYLHMGGKIGVVTVLEGTTDSESAKDVSMHVAAMNPTFVTRDEMSEEFIAKERKIQQELMKADPKFADKAEDFLSKIVDGKLNKQFQAMCLVDQAFVKNSDQTVGAFVKSLNGTVGKVVRFGVGEGIDKKEVDFASEVMSQVNA